MRRLYLLVSIFISFTLSSCTTMNNGSTSHPTTPIPASTKTQTRADTESLTTIKSPLAIQVYSKGTKLNHPYKVIARESVSKYNAGGIKRQEANIHDALRNIAASVGGDAVINITREESKVTGTVVSFDKKNVG